MNQSEKQYIDLPINLEDTPHHLIQKAVYVLANDPEEVAHEFLRKLEQSIKKENQQQLYCLTTVYFQQADTQKFVNIDWPRPEDLQAKKQCDYMITAQTLYNELVNRKKFQKAKSNEEEFFNIVLDCWQTYTTIFQHQLNKVKYHPILIWDFMENFTYQFSQYHFRLPTLSSQKVKKQWFNYQKTIEILKKMEEAIPQNPSSKVIHTQQIFGYYSLVVRATLESYFGNYSEALNIISKIGSNCLIWYSKAFGAQLCLFLTSSYCYFMLEQYSKCARLCELILFFFQKYKKYLTKFSDRNLTRQYQKLVGMLSLAYIFLEEKPKNDIMDIFKNTAVKTKDRQYKEKISDKYIKIKQNDSNSFLKLFNFSSLPLIGSKNQVENRQKQILIKFTNIQQITLNTIVQNYKEIPIQKLATLLNITVQQVTSQIQQFNQIKRTTSPWQSTIMFPLLRQRRKVNLQIEGNLLKIDQSSQNQRNMDWQSYIEQLSWLGDKVQKL